MRKAVLFRLKDKSMMEEYKKRHDSIWREVLDIIKASGIKNYSIWNVDDILVGYYEIENENADKKAMEILFGEPKFLEWRNYMKDIISSIDKNENKEYQMKLMFFVE